MESHSNERFNEIGWCVRVHRTVYSLLGPSGANRAAAAATLCSSSRVSGAMSPGAPCPLRCMTSMQESALRSARCRCASSIVGAPRSVSGGAIAAGRPVTRAAAAPSAAALGGDQEVRRIERERGLEAFEPEQHAQRLAGGRIGIEDVDQPVAMQK